MDIEAACACSYTTFVIRGCGTGSLVEFWPAFRVGEPSGSYIGIGGIRWAEGDKTGPIWIVDVAEVLEAE